MTNLLTLLSSISVRGDSCSPDLIRIRDFLARNGLFHEYEPSPDVSVKCPDGTVLVNPTNSELAKCLGLTTAPTGTYDVTVIGAGPAGLACAVYASSEGLRTLVLERDSIGGQAGTSSRIENYLGFPEGISGRDLAKRARAQAEKFGTEFCIGKEATRIEPWYINNPVLVPDTRLGYLVDGISTRTVVIATGARYRKPNIPNRETFEGKGIFYHAMHVQADLVRGQPVVVVGGANSAGQAALFLAQRASHVYILARRDLNATMSQYLINRIFRTGNISIARTEIQALAGDTWLREVTWDGEPRKIPYVFLMTGAEPNTEPFRNVAGLDEKGFVKSTPPGIFAIGDVRSGSVKRVATAAGEGAMVVSKIHEYLT